MKSLKTAILRVKFPYEFKNHTKTPLQKYNIETINKHNGYN